MESAGVLQDASALRYTALYATLKGEHTRAPVVSACASTSLFVILMATLTPADALLIAPVHSSPTLAPADRHCKQSSSCGGRFHGLKCAGPVDWMQQWLSPKNCSAALVASVILERMCMALECLELERLLVNLIVSRVPFWWNDIHTQVIRRLKQRLVDCTSLQVPEYSKAHQLYTDASGHTTGDVLEQELGYVMSPVQYKYSAYDQELLALVMPFEKRKYILEATDDMDHQALAQQLNSS
ncbi:uncharacterized protein EMH_0003470 [Eimeria mitis]|uniref:Reverse transcriptase/retrotransposon-derived protein RNase H-like domain-containing protein n=1 Tax=Eimeria mitis TaxID=44415 RepID=U6KG69_9EIME|nr:uncharacterized protein EMH_0003470 [Eimeria mitis]CDJ35257.1 hypothetical protein EMH_0003470 [Eimeria mitis]